MFHDHFGPCGLHANYMCTYGQEMVELLPCFFDPQADRAYPSAPTIFSLLKWKSDEHHIDHLLQSYSRIVSRALQLICQNLYLECESLGFRAMFGVRDKFRAVNQLRQTEIPPVLRERDLNDILWEIPRQCARVSGQSNVGMFVAERNCGSYWRKVETKG